MYITVSIIWNDNLILLLTQAISSSSIYHSKNTYHTIIGERERQRKDKICVEGKRRDIISISFVLSFNKDIKIQYLFEDSFKFIMAKIPFLSYHILPTQAIVRNNINIGHVSLNNFSFLTSY